MRIRLTQIAAERMTPPKTGRLVVWDTVLPSFGMRVTAKGAKSWFVHYRVGGGANGQRVFETIGTLAKIPKVNDARQAARDSMEKAAAGANPVIQKKAVAAAAITVAAAVARYLAECDGNLKPKTAKEWRRIFEHDVLPRWGDRPLAGITKGDVLELVNDKAARRERERRGMAGGAAVQAGKMLIRLRTFFGWTVANDLVAADPTTGVRRPAKEASRDRVLTDDEIHAFWEGTGQLATFGNLFRLMLLTAQRESEVAGIRRLELDIEKRTWTIPGARSKNGKPHIVHLSAPAIEILEQVSLVAGQDLLFSGTGKTAVSGFSRAKARLDRLMGGEIAPWVLHDLRRTATTGMARIGIAPHVADRVLNHQAGTIRGVAAVYNRFEYLEERKAALEAWGRLVESLARPALSNVVPLVAAG